MLSALRKAKAVKRPMPDGLEVVLINRVESGSLGAFFSALMGAGDGVFFHPHPLTPAGAIERVGYHGIDLYYAVLEGDRILAYGMLRGWDEGYDIPSLGIAVHPSERGRGLGEFLMRFLAKAARRRGATSVRLTVDESNLRAIALYRRLGYDFQAFKTGSLLGLLQLHDE